MSEFEKWFGTWRNSYPKPSKISAEFAFNAGRASHDEEVAELKRQLAEKDARYADLLNVEHELSDAYIRLRKILGALDTPYGPSAQQVWNHTEVKATALVHQLSSARDAALVEAAKAMCQFCRNGNEIFFDEDVAGHTGDSGSLVYHCKASKIHRLRQGGKP